MNQEKVMKYIYFTEMRSETKDSFSVYIDRSCSRNFILKKQRNIALVNEVHSMLVTREIRFQ